MGRGAAAIAATGGRAGSTGGPRARLAQPSRQSAALRCPLRPSSHPRSSLACPPPPPPPPAGGLLARDEINPVLNGTLPGDYGYDPLGLAKDSETLAKYQANELLHARWAMLAAAGAIIPEGLAANGADVKGATWFETGAAMLNGGTLNWFAVPIANISNPLPLFAVVAVNTALMAAVENYRRTEAGPAGYSPGVGKFDESAYSNMDSLYPGGPFDPLVRAWEGGVGGGGGVWGRAPSRCQSALRRLARQRLAPAHAPSPLHPLLHPRRAWPTTPRCWLSSR